MNRGTARSVVLLLLLGMSINLGIAWSCALWSDLTENTPPRTGGIPRDVDTTAEMRAWRTRRYPLAESIDIKRRDFAGPGVQFDVLELTEYIPYADGIGPSRICQVCATGWPLRAFRCVGYLDWPSDMDAFGGRPGGRDPIRPAHGWRAGANPPVWLHPARGIPSFFFSDSERPLPMRPLAVGCIINSLLFAAAGGVLIFVPRWLRRRLRRRHNACAHCAYDRSGLPAGGPCPECGAPSPKHANGRVEQEVRPANAPFTQHVR